MTARSVLVIAAFAAIPVVAGDGYDWNLPKGFPKPSVPTDNPVTAAKAELGRHLFYDRRMSLNGQGSCATCHQQERAFTDGRTVGVGVTGEKHTRSSMSLVNIAYGGALTWNNPAMTALEEQALVPMFGEHPVELGLKHDDHFASVMRSDPMYQRLTTAAFPNEPNPFTTTNIVRAIAAFERTIISARSPYDRYHYGGDDTAVTEAAKRGEVLFFSQHISCFRCHGGFNFSDATVSERSVGREVEFHDTGVQSNAGKFKTPTLRNVAVTAPYMHDGSIATLEEVIDHYAAGGRNGHDNAGKDHLVGGFPLTAQQRADLVAFLKSLTDDELLHDPKFSNPW